ncbi:MAG: hypothetical protein U5Q44_10825 [Dehalococcoidia bacterium]|nr:hypothetical protein [Dehalococcoidia bacterium]
MNFFAFWFSDRMALKMAGAREVTEQEEPRLYAMVNEVANLAGSCPCPDRCRGERNPERVRHGTEPAEGRGGRHWRASGKS